MMKKQQQWRLLFKVFSQTLTPLINYSSSSSSSSPSCINARPFCSLATTTNKQQQLLDKKLPLLIVPIVQKKNMNIVEKKEMYIVHGNDDDEVASTVCDDTLGFISLFDHGNDDDDELINNNNNNNNNNKEEEEEEVHMLYLPEIADRRICGSSEGWLVTVHENGEIQLLNPFSKVLVNLPPLTAFPGVVAKFITEEIVGDELVPKHKRGQLCYLVDEEGYRLSLSSSSRTYPFSWFVIDGSHRFREFFLEKVVTNTNTTTIDANSTTTTTTSVVGPTVVMAIYGCSNKLAFCRPSSGIDDDEKNKWISCLEGGQGGGWQDVTFYKGNFYAVRHNGCVNVVKGLDGPSPFLETIIQKPDVKSLDCVCMNYLVESSSSSSSSSGGGGDLLLVMRDVIDEEDEEEEEGFQYRTIEFRVLKLEFNTHGPSWVEVTNLGEDCALFIGYNHSFSFSASKFPGCRGNCIYFTDNLDKIYCNTTGGHDIGVYNLEDDSIEKLNYETSSSQLFMPPPIWYVPN